MRTRSPVRCPAGWPGRSPGSPAKRRGDRRGLARTIGRAAVAGCGRCSRRFRARRGGGCGPDASARRVASPARRRGGTLARRPSLAPSVAAHRLDACRAAPPPCPCAVALRAARFEPRLQGAPGRGRLQAWARSLRQRQLDRAAAGGGGRPPVGAFRVRRPVSSRCV